MLADAESRASNTIRLPSGDHRGEPGLFCSLPSEVNATGFLPSASLRQISPKPVRSDVKIIHLPSGETWGLESARVDRKRSPGPDTIAGSRPARISSWLSAT